MDLQNDIQTNDTTIGTLFRTTRVVAWMYIGEELYKAQSFDLLPQESLGTSWEMSFRKSAAIERMDQHDIILENRTEMHRHAWI
jgi:hypothetical protein